MFKSKLIIFSFSILILQAKSSELTQENKENCQSEFVKKPKVKPISNCKDDEFVHCNQNIIQYGIVKKVQYFPCSRDSKTCSINVNPSSACIRCEICLSIVDQINQTLIFVYDRIRPRKGLNETTIEALLKIICDDSFTNYGLRIVGSKRMIFDRVPNSNLVITSVDGEWENHLRKRCYDLTDGLGSSKLHEHWKSWWEAKTEKLASRLEDELCNDRGSFLRDCWNLHRPEPPGSRHAVESVGNESLRKRLAEFFNNI